MTYSSQMNVQRRSYTAKLKITGKQATISHATRRDSVLTRDDGTRYVMPEVLLIQGVEIPLKDIEFAMQKAVEEVLSSHSVEVEWLRLVDIYD